MEYMYQQTRKEWEKLYVNEDWGGELGYKKCSNMEKELYALPEHRLEIPYKIIEL